ncbi:hypothetical protein FM120_22590 [Sphingobacterium faecium PCAi_F2.5]|nr:hypothetical protein FM120_22590 [Sphingobacterium faecium PCAi_F2.5]
MLRERSFAISTDFRADLGAAVRPASHEIKRSHIAIIPIN